MFKSKTTKHSTLRFCQRATELPYGPLWSYREFTVAISRTSQFKVFPSEGRASNPQAIGILHGSSTFHDGSEEPILPVRIEFEPDPRGHDGHLGDGWLDKHYGQDEEFFVLELSIRDPGLKLFREFDQAVERAALSGFNYFHARFKKNEGTLPLETDGNFSKRYDQQGAHLKAVEAGEAGLKRVVCDEVLFWNRMTTKAPSWAYGWPEYEMDAPAFQSAGTAKRRAQTSKWDK